MPELRCACGTRFQVSDALAGRKARCPSCQATIPVLAASAPPQNPAGTRSPAAPGPPAPARQAKRVTAPAQPIRPTEPSDAPAERTDEPSSERRLRAESQLRRQHRMRPIQTWGSLALLVIILIAAIALWRPFRHDPVEVVSSAKLGRHDTGTRLAVRLDVEVLPRDQSGGLRPDQKEQNWFELALPDFQTLDSDREPLGPAIKILLADGFDHVRQVTTYLPSGRVTYQSFTVVEGADTIEADVDFNVHPKKARFLRFRELELVEIPW